MGPNFRKTCALLSAFLFIIPISPLNGQIKETGYFPKIIIGSSAGYYNSFIKDFEEKNNKALMFGGIAAIKLFNHGSKKAIYHVAQLHNFNTKERTSDWVITSSEKLVKWRERFINLGLRFSINHVFMQRQNTQFWLGTGISILDVKRTNIRFSQQYIIENNRSRKIYISDNVVEKWQSKSVYVEIGQLIPFETSDSPNFGISWNLKCDLGKDKNLNIGSFSANVGLHLTILY